MDARCGFCIRRAARLRELSRKTVDVCAPETGAEEAASDLRLRKSSRRLTPTAIVSLGPNPPRNAARAASGNT
jgi:hypothetical protein